MNVPILTADRRGRNGERMIGRYFWGDGMDRLVIYKDTSVYLI